MIVLECKPARKRERLPSGRLLFAATVLTTHHNDRVTAKFMLFQNAATLRICVGGVGRWFKIEVKQVLARFDMFLCLGLSTSTSLVAPRAVKATHHRRIRSDVLEQATVLGCCVQLCRHISVSEQSAIFPSNIRYDIEIILAVASSSVIWYEYSYEYSYMAKFSNTVRTVLYRLSRTHTVLFPAGRCRYGEVNLSRNSVPAVLTVLVLV